MSANTIHISNKKNEDINEILRGEISATEAYDQVMEKVTEDPEAYRLRQLKLDHENAVQFWKREARLSGKVPEQESGIWGAAVETFIGSSKLISEKTALKALKKGEEHGLSNYMQMLQSNKLDSAQKSEIRETFIPRQKRHIQSIDNLLYFDREEKIANDPFNSHTH